MNNLALCGNCCWIGDEAQLLRSEQKHPINASLKSIIQKNDLKCYSTCCPLCGSDLIYRKLNSINLPSVWVEPVDPPGEVTVASYEAPKECEIETTTNANSVEDFVEQEDIDVDIVESLLSEASDLEAVREEEEEVKETKKVNFIDNLDPPAVRPAKTDKVVKCDRCNKEFIIPAHATHSSKRCDSCMEKLRKMIGD